jgi:predicted nucleic acid-binding Zn finger protein
MTSVTATADSAPLAARLSQTLADIRKADSVAYLTLFLAVVFGFTSWFFQLSVQLALLVVLLVPSVAKRPAIWGLLAIMASITLVLERDLADNHKYLLCYWLWVMCIAHIPDGREQRDEIIGFNARFFLIFIFLGAALQKFVSSSYMSGAMFELELLLDGRFQAFAHLTGIDAGLVNESVRRLLLLRNPYVQVLNDKILLLSDDRVHFVANLITLYDFYVQVAIGALLLFRRAVTDLIANVLLLFFIFTTYIPAPVLGFGFTLAILGFALVKERSQLLSAAYLLSMAAVLFYQVPWRDWVLGT